MNWDDDRPVWPFVLLAACILGQMAISFEANHRASVLQKRVAVLEKESANANR